MHTMISTTSQSSNAATVGRRFNVVGMTCSHCERGIEAEVSLVPGVTHVVADAAAGTVIVESTCELAIADVAAAVDEAGYELAR